MFVIVDGVGLLVTGMFLNELMFLLDILYISKVAASA